jgi:hypothetical protein
MRPRKLFHRVMWSYVPCTWTGCFVTGIGAALIAGSLGGSWLLADAFYSSVPMYCGAAFAALIFIVMMRFAYRHS